MTATSLFHPAHLVGRLVFAIVILGLIASAWLVVRPVHSVVIHTNPGGVSHLAPPSPVGIPAQSDRWICRGGLPC
jgi:hypothetical protein